MPNFTPKKLTPAVIWVRERLPYQYGKNAIGRLMDLELPVTVVPEESIPGVSCIIVGALYQQHKEISALAEGDATVRADVQNGFFGMSHVTVHPSPVEPLTVTPSMSQQHFTAPEGTVGYNPVTIEDCVGQQKRVVPSMSQQTVVPTDRYLFIEEVTVEPVNAQARTVTAVEDTEIVVEAEQGYDGLSSVTVNPPGYTDFTWVFEAKMGNHPVVTAEEMAELAPYIEQPYGGTGLFRYAQNITSIDLGGIEEVNTHGLSQFAEGITSLISVSFPDLTTVNGNNAMNRAFYGCISLTNITIPNLISVSGINAMGDTFFNSNVEYVDLSNLGQLHWLTKPTGGNWANGIMYRTFYGCTNLKRVKLPKSLGDDYRKRGWGSDAKTGWVQTFYGCTALTEIDASELTTLKYIDENNTVYETNYGEYQMFAGCTSLEEVNFPELTTWSWYGFADGFRGCTRLKTVKLPKLSSLGPSLYNNFSGCSALRNVYAHPNVFKYYSSNQNLYSIFWNNTTINNITLSTNSSTSLRLSQWTLLASSVKDILQHCDNNNMNGKSVTFKSGLTITDDAEGSIATLKASVTAQGCTINNLTINQLVNIDSPSGTVTKSASLAHTSVTLTVTPYANYAIDTVTVTDYYGNPVTVTDNGDNTYTYTQPACSVDATIAYTQTGTLPYDTEIEYLESDGAQSMDSGIIPTDYDNTIEAKITFLGYTTTGLWTAWFAAYTNENSNAYRIIRNNGSNTQVLVYNGRKASGGGTTYNVTVGNTYNIKLSPTSGNINGTSITYNSTTGNQNTSSLKLFYSGSKTRVFNFKLSKGNTVLLNAIPVRVGTVGYMYDRISGNLYGNTGTGSFTLGPDVD